jgi:hypothetical protein
MRNRRLLLLAAVLAALWLVPSGLALLRGHVVLATLFGKNMMRADVTMNSGAEWRVDRGTVVTNATGLLTLHETDGRVQAITVSSTTKVSDGNGNTYSISGLKPGWRVLVIWPALGGSADSVKIEKRGTSS